MTVAADFDFTPLTHLPDPVREDARSFVINSWIRSFQHHRGAGLSNEVYAPEQRNLVLRLLSEATTTVATQHDAPDLFVAYCCRQGPTAHFVYTKLAYRQLCIAKRLMQGVETITHYPTEDPERRRRGLPTGEFIRDWIEREDWTYSPYALMR